MKGPAAEGAGGPGGAAEAPGGAALAEAVQAAARKAAGRADVWAKAAPAAGTGGRNLDFGTSRDWLEHRAVQEVAAEADDEPPAPAPAPEPEPEPAVEEEQRPGGEGAGGWERAWNAEYRAWYYFRRADGATTWTRPAEWGPQDDAAAADAAAPEAPQGWVPVTEVGAAAPEERRPTEEGEEKQKEVFFYRDAGGAVQGGFSLETLQSWRPALPMDLRVWFQGEGARAHVQALAVDSRLSRAEGETLGVPFATITGDLDLLKQFREERGDAAGESGTAPCAPAFADAVGLEARGMKLHGGEAGAAAVPSTGATAQGFEDYAAVGFFNARTRHLQADEGMAGTVSEQLPGTVPTGHAGAYRFTGLHHHMDPATLEQQLAEMGRAKNRKFSKKEIEKLKARKLALKQKRQGQSWLHG